MLRRFEGNIHAGDYAKYRPEWPPVIYDKLVSYIKEGGGVLHQAVDVGCGTGISTRLLAQRFEKVIGADVSEAMLSQAPKEANITYHVSQGEDLSFIPDNSIDAVTCAASIHWLDQKRFYEEVDRILKPGGVVASFTYGMEHMLDNTEADRLVQEFDEVVLKKYFDKVAYDSIHLFHTIEQPYEDYVRYVDLSLEKTWPLSDFLGYVSTVSATRKIIDSGSNEFDDFANKLLEVYKRDPKYKDKENISFEHVTVTSSWDIKLNLSRKPPS